MDKTKYFLPTYLFEQYPPSEYNEVCVVQLQKWEELPWKTLSMYYLRTRIGKLFAKRCLKLAVLANRSESEAVCKTFLQTASLFK